MLDTKVTVIFDGECRVCQALKAWAEKREAEGKLQFVAYQNVDFDPLAPGLTREMASGSLYLVDGGGRVYSGARAVFEIAKHLPGVWGVLGRILSLPGISLLAEPFYKLFARHRHQISQRLRLKE